jgi:ribosomal protein S12 methylthiotransferase accessory factor
VDLGQFDDPYIRDLKIQLAQTGRRLWLLDVTSDLGIPTFITIAHWMEDGQEFVDFGSGAHFDARIAALRAMTELNQFLSIGLMGGRSANPLVRKRVSKRAMTAVRYSGCATIPI